MDPSIPGALSENVVRPEIMEFRNVSCSFTSMALHLLHRIYGRNPPTHGSTGLSYSAPSPSPWLHLESEGKSLWLSRDKPSNRRDGSLEEMLHEYLNAIENGKLSMFELGRWFLSFAMASAAEFRSLMLTALDDDLEAKLVKAMETHFPELHALGDSDQFMNGAVKQLKSQLTGWC